MLSEVRIITTLGGLVTGKTPEEDFQVLVMLSDLSVSYMSVFRTYTP